MLKIIKLSIFLFFIFFQHLFADVISKITVEGNKRITKETIIVYGGIDKSKEMTKESLDTITKNLYETNFFQDISIKLSTNKLSILVEENPIIENITFNGIKSSTLKEKILEGLRLNTRSSYDKILLINDPGFAARNIRGIDKIIPFNLPFTPLPVITASSY